MTISFSLPDKCTISGLEYIKFDVLQCVGCHFNCYVTVLNTVTFKYPLTAGKRCSSTDKVHDKTGKGGKLVLWALFWSISF